VLELISHTTKEGLTVMAVKDSHTYPTGIKVSDEEFAALNLSRDSFHGEVNSPAGHRRTAWQQAHGYGRFAGMLESESTRLDHSAD